MHCGRHSGLMVNALAPDQTIRVHWGSPGWGHCVVLLIPFSTQVYKWALANLILGVTLQWILNIQIINKSYQMVLCLPLDRGDRRRKRKLLAKNLTPTGKCTLCGIMYISKSCLLKITVVWVLIETLSGHSINTWWTTQSIPSVNVSVSTWMTTAGE